MEGKPTRPDSRFIKEGVAISKERQEVAKAAVIAKAEMRTRRPRRGIAREDLLVHDAKMVCKSVLHGIKQLRKIGVVIAAPAYDPVEIERHVRTAFRKDPPVSETMSVRGLLPQAWTEASTQAFVLPLDGSPLPEPAPPSAPVAVVPKAKYRPECAPLTEADYAAIAAWDAAEAQCEAEQKAAAATCESANKEAVLGDENERTPLETPSERPLIPPRRKQPPSIFDGSPTGAEVAVARDPRLRWPARRTAQTNDHVQVNAAETPRESGDHHSAVIRLSTPIGPHGEWHLR
jgi:hypothetical protein